MPPQVVRQGATRIRSPLHILGLGAAVAAAALLCPHSARADEVLVSAAASLTDAMNAIGRAYGSANPGTTVRFNFGASGALQQQIAHGAPVDVFAPASPRELDALTAARRTEPETRVNFAGNRLVLIALAHSALKRWDELRGVAVRRIAISDPESVPSGRYARETLLHRGLWSVVQPKAVIGENVRQTLAYVATGNADAGIVFATDARIEPVRVRVADQAQPGADHSPILYPAAVIKDAPNPLGARRFIRFLTGPTAQAILARFGFTSAVPTAAPRPSPASRGPRQRLKSR